MAIGDIIPPTIDGLFSSASSNHIVKEAADEELAIVQSSFVTLDKPRNDFAIVWDGFAATGPLPSSIQSEQGVLSRAIKVVDTVADIFDAMSEEEYNLTILLLNIRSSIRSTGQ